jgi:hypothetical protein
MVNGCAAAHRAENRRFGLTKTLACNENKCEQKEIKRGRGNSLTDLAVLRRAPGQEKSALGHENPL